MITQILKVCNEIQHDTSETVSFANKFEVETKHFFSKFLSSKEEKIQVCP